MAVVRGFLGSVWYMVLDGLIAGFLLATGWLAGAADFFAGGYPMSWVFVLAFTTNLRWTIVVALTLHGLVRGASWPSWAWNRCGVVGSVQFIVVAVIVGWAFDSLRAKGVDEAPGRGGSGRGRD